MWIHPAIAAEGMLWASLFSQGPRGQSAFASCQRAPQTAASQKLNLVRANQALIKVSYITSSSSRARA